MLLPPRAEKQSAEVSISNQGDSCRGWPRVTIAVKTSAGQTFREGGRRLYFVTLPLMGHFHRLLTEPASSLTGKMLSEMQPCSDWIRGTRQEIF